MTQEQNASGDPSPEVSRRVQNLQAVARHLMTQGGSTTGPGAGNAAAGSQTRFPESEGANVAARNRWKRWGPLGVVLALVLGKLKLVVPLLKMAKLTTLASMLLAVGLYTQLWGATFAIGFVLLIFVHEMGHAWAMRRCGIPAGAPVFIPFVGAVIAMRGVPRSAWVEALVAIGGPILGSAGAILCLLVGILTESALFYALASTGFLINLFNLLPISPLDGGRIVGVISRWIWLVGYAVGIGMFLVTHHPLLFLILLFGLFNLRHVIRGPRPGYYEVPPSKRLAMGVAYFGLAAFLAFSMSAVDARLEHLQPTTEVQAQRMPEVFPLLLGWVLWSLVPEWLGRRRETVRE